MSLIDWIREHKPLAITAAAVLALGGGIAYAQLGMGAGSEPAANTPGTSVSVPTQCATSPKPAPTKAPATTQPGKDTPGPSSAAPSTTQVPESELPENELVGGFGEQAPEEKAPDGYAEAFMKAWLYDPAKSKEQWLRGLRPLVTDRLYESLSDAGPDLVPEGEVERVYKQKQTGTFADIKVTLKDNTVILLAMSPMADGSWKTNLLSSDD